MTSLIEKWQTKLAATRDNEDGAETIEIIVFLAIFVLGMVAVWVMIRNASREKGQEITDCLNNSNSNSGMQVGTNTNC